MSLRSLAEQDLGEILEDSTAFGWPITVTSPEQVSVNLIGFSNDIAETIDPDTGMIVSGRVASVALRLSSLAAAGLSIPIGIVDSSKKPWVIEFSDINSNPHKFKVRQTNPDRGLGLVTCMLETYK